jgi:hypothetical protein
MLTKTSLPGEHQSQPERPPKRRDLRGEPLGGGQNSRWVPVWGVLVLAALAIGARVALRWQLPFPQCWLKKLTGIPCPTCGTTRSLAAWSHLDLSEAFRFNPLIFLICVGIILWAALRVAERLMQRGFMPDLRSRVSGQIFWKAGIGLLALNWLYLCLTLPR